MKFIQFYICFVFAKTVLVEAMLQSSSSSTFVLFLLERFVGGDATAQNMARYALKKVGTYNLGN